MDRLLTACRDGNLDDITASLSDNHTAADLQRALFEAITAKRVDVVDLLLARGLSLDKLSLIRAARVQSKEVYQCFLDHGWDINSLEHGHSALSMVVSNPTLVNWLLEHGADPNLKNPPIRAGPGVSPMRSAMGGNYLPAIRVLLAHGARLEKDLFEPCVLPRLDDIVPLESLQFLLDAGLDPNVVLEEYHTGTPLQLTARRGMLEKARVLLLAGARQDVTDHKDQTPLEEAIAAHNEEMVELLRSFA